MSNNNNNDHSSSIYLLFCIAFAVVGVWWPSYFMWVVYAFLGYVAVMAVLTLVVGILGTLIICKLRKRG